jgi:peptide-methionine (S)-S-oxide reductase
VFTKIGYTGGSLKDPTYEDVCSGLTGHAEAIEIEFDEEKISYKKLLDVFWKIHNPTTIDRQGPDVGSQYKSAIFYHDEEQKKIAEKSKEEEQRNYDYPIVTEIISASEFYKAEEYHQKYLMKNSGASCSI